MDQSDDYPLPRSIVPIGTPPVYSIFGVLLAVILMGLKYAGNTATAAAGIDDDYDPLEDDEL